MLASMLEAKADPKGQFGKTIKYGMEGYFFSEKHCSAPYAPYGKCYRYYFLS